MSANPEIGELRMRCKWDIKHGGFEYFIEKFFKDNRGYIDSKNNIDPPSWHILHSSFDGDWAERTREHFSLEIIEDEEAK